MIIQWNGSGLKVIPCLDIAETDKVILAPGNNEVEEKHWKAARVHVLEEMKGTNPDIVETIAAEVTEKVADVPVIDDETKEPKLDPKTEKPITEKKKEVIIKAKAFKKLSIEDAIEIVKDTYNPTTLKQWEKAEGRNAVRAEIQNRIEEIETRHEDRKKKLEQGKNK